MPRFDVHLPVAMLALFTATAGLAPAQTVTLDEGAFRLFVDGREVGTETFSIRRNGNGGNAVTIARGRVLLDGGRGAEEIVASLEVSGDEMRPSAYQVTVQGDESQRIAGRMVGGRFSAKILSPRGEMMREYLADDGAVLLDGGVVHHYYFLARRMRGAAFVVPVIIPRESRQITARVAPVGSEMVEIDGQRVEARHFTVEPDGGDTCHLWVDAQGRILQFEIPARAYAARRVSLP